VQDRMKKLTDRLESLDSSQAEARSKLGDSESGSAQLKVEVVTPKVSIIQSNKRKRTDELPLHTNDSNETAEYSNPIADSLDNMSTIKEEPMDPKEEPVDTTEAISNTNQAIENECDNVMEDDLIEKEGENEDFLDHASDAVKDTINDELIEKDGKNKRKIDSTPHLKNSSETVEVEKLRRSSRRVSKPKKHNEFLDDYDTEPAVKKLKSDSQEETKKIDRKRRTCKKEDSTIQDRTYFKTNDTELACLECDAGVTLLCECGDESASNYHWTKCPIAKFTINRKREGPIRRLTDPKTTPKCVMCEIYPSTSGGYISHLDKIHKSTLKENGIAWLMCKCGLKVRSSSDRIQCDHLEFSIHKLDEK
ncbi:hypothetical protein PENTCL1PPCAC_8139, partial [Pristionchus entomophagus]